MKNKLHYFFILIFTYSCNSSDKFIVIKNVNLFDGENYFTDVNVILDSNIIYDVTKEKIWSFGSTVINGKDKTIIPPLLNAHVHVWNKENLREAFNAGVLGLFDMHATEESAAYLKGFRDSVGYAYYYSSGPGATVPGGHGTQYGVYVPTIDSTTSPEKFVEERIRNNADYIKILREPYMVTIDFEQTKKVINTAHKYNKLCVAHVSVLSDAMELASQNVDGFVHIWSNEKATDAQLDSLSAKKVFIVPTLYVVRKALASWGIYESFDNVLKDTYEAYLKRIPILAGTDAPNFNFNYGTDLYLELELLHSCGISNIDVLKTATTNISSAFKIKEFGLLKKGSSANFLLIDGNPVNNIKDIRKVASIWLNGQEIKH